MKTFNTKNIVAPVAALTIGVLSASPFDGAKWLCPAEMKNAVNSRLEIRRRFEASGAKPVQLAIAADTVARVSLNGKVRVETLRFPDVPPQRYYDVLPLSDIRTGSNELLLELYIQGTNTFQHICGDPGVIFSLSGDGVQAASDSFCEWRSVPALRPDVPMLTQQLGFTFEYDARKQSGTWRRFSPADIAKDASDYRFERRPVPRVEVGEAIPATTIAVGALDGSPADPMPADGMDRTKMAPIPRTDFFSSDGKSVRSELFRNGFYYLIDLGREEAGLLTLDVDTDEGAVLDIGHAEHFEDGRIRTKIARRNFCGRYIATAGRQSYLRWERRMAGRYIQLHVRGVKTHFRLNRLTVRPTTVPLSRLAPPKLSDARERKIWDVGVRTLELCLHEHYEDCPWREQGLYANDSRNQILAGYHAFGKDNRFPEMSLEILSRGIGSDGWVELCMPTRCDLKIPSFTFCWVLAVRDNLRYRGRSDFTKRMMPSVAKVLDTRRSEIREGLLPCPQGKIYWQFYDWAEGLSGSVRVKPGELRFESPLNLFFVLALEAGAEVAAANGEQATAAHWRQAAAELRPRIRERFWDSARQEFAFSEKGKGKGSELVQSLGILAGAVPPAAKAQTVEKLLGPSDWIPATLSQMLYKYEALTSEGGDTARRAIRQMDDIWGEMLDQGATSFWEVRDGWKAFGAAGSLCHGWSAIPLYIYSTAGATAVR